MTVEIDEGSGFCFGVVNAIRKAEEELGRSGRLYCLGDIVHNAAEVERLRRSFSGRMACRRRPMSSPDATA